MHKCEECNKEFDSEQALGQHNNAKHEVKEKKEQFNIKKGHIISVVAIIAILGVGFWIYSASTGPGKHDAFAQCITEEGAKFFGAFWCAACNQQKGHFGKSMEFVNYIECSTPDAQDQTEICIQEGIQTYPTWEFSDGTKVPGVQTLQSLSQRTGCLL